jgi:hypothetical protein
MTVKPIAGVTFDGTTSFVAAVISPTNPTVPVAGVASELSLPRIQALTYGSAAPGVPFANGASFAFVLVGDPAQPQFLDPADGGAFATPDGGATGACLIDPTDPCTFNLRSAHVLAFPTFNQ